MQKGQIKQVGNCWLLRYYEPVFENGRSVMRQKSTKLKLDPKAISQKEQEKALESFSLRAASQPTSDRIRHL